MAFTLIGSKLHKLRFSSDVSGSGREHFRVVPGCQAAGLLHERSLLVLAQLRRGSGSAIDCRANRHEVDVTIDYVSSFAAAPRGLLKLSSGIGSGVNVLSAIVPRFMAMYPHVDVSIELTSKNVDLVTEGIDIAIRMGPMPNSGMMTTRLASIPRYMCASP